MTTKILKSTLKLFTVLFCMSAIISCDSKNKTKTNNHSTKIDENEIISDTIIQFLITSACNDFRNSPTLTPVDFRNAKIGYTKSSNNKKTYLLCGEFLSKEDNEWIEFTTIKTSGYEQYIGKNQYCQNATMVMTDKNLSQKLKNKLTE